jgi:lysozyme family protein
MNYSERFNNFIPFILAAETVFARGHYGDYSKAVCECVKGDGGKLTKYGIDKTSHPHIDIRALTQDTAEQVYNSEWQAEQCEKYPFPFGECFFDAAVNCGVARASKILAKTGQDAAAFLNEREAFYRRLAAAVKSDKQFLAGWLARIQHLRAYLKI